MPDEYKRGGDWGIVCPFWIDTDAYSDRDREMFIAGFEFAQVYNHVVKDPGKLRIPIHRENESRFKMLCAKFGRRCRIEQCSEEHDPDGTWSDMVIFASGGR